MENKRIFVNGFSESIGKISCGGFGILNVTKMLLIFLQGLLQKTQVIFHNKLQTS